MQILNPFQEDAAIFAHHFNKWTTAYIEKFYLLLITLIAWLGGYMKLDQTDNYCSNFGQNLDWVIFPLRNTERL